MERPKFAAQWPEEPKLDALLEAFDRGDFAAVAAGAKRLADHADPKVRAAASELAERTRPDPMLKWLFLGILILVLVVSGYWLSATR